MRRMAKQIAIREKFRLRSDRSAYNLRLVLGGTAGQRSFRCVGLQLFWGLEDETSNGRSGGPFREISSEISSRVAESQRLIRTLAVDSAGLLPIFRE